MAPVGTVAVMLVAVAAVIVALVAPKKMMLLAAVVLKLVPVRVTTSPGLAEAGLKEVIIGIGGARAHCAYSVKLAVCPWVYGNVMAVPPLAAINQPLKV